LKPKTSKGNTCRPLGRGAVDGRLTDFPIGISMRFRTLADHLATVSKNAVKNRGAPSSIDMMLANAKEQPHCRKLRSVGCRGLDPLRYETMGILVDRCFSRVCNSLDHFEREPVSSRRLPIPQGSLADQVCTLRSSPCLLDWSRCILVSCIRTRNESVGNLFNRGIFTGATAGQAV
jgi:hypothetical protein